ncbi:MAG: ribonuclease E/G [Chitinophagales bacterium]
MLQRQHAGLRLRDIGGIVVVDFIDMKKAANKKEVYDKMRELLKQDKATTNVLPLSKFNLMQITRERVRPQIEIATRKMPYLQWHRKNRSHTAFNG